MNNTKQLNKTAESSHSIKLRKWYKNILKFLKKQIENQLKKLDIGITDTLLYSSLAPLGNLDIANDYQQALNWALTNREQLDIKNIALTGPYGSGKSSIIKTYIRHNDDSDLHFLTISLATFKEENIPQGSNNSVTGELPTKKEDLLRLIELSILQQIFYHEEDKRIPDSRFRKIKKTPNHVHKTIGLLLFLMTLSLLQIFYGDSIRAFLSIQITYSTILVINYISAALLLITIAALCLHSAKLINTFKITKLTIQNADIEIDSGISKSILNHHLDEILYFFEVTKYNVVVIEDLDRFQQTEIFTKLREINLLLNQSKKVNKWIVFIYAVRDEIFRETNERTKFFDFIIPIIPIINPGNSSQKLLEKIKKTGIDVSENLIDTISVFIDDMRLLQNIFNEFILYNKKISTKLNQDKLLAIVTYKNLFPYDFTLLSKDDGLLYKTLNSKTKLINSLIQDAEKEISEARNEIKRIQEIKFKDEVELRSIYVLKAISMAGDFYGFNIDGNRTHISQMTSESYFDRLANNQANYYYDYYYSSPRKLQNSFKEIENQVDANQTYSERYEDLKKRTAQATTELTSKIRRNERLKDQYKNWKIKDLLSNSHINLEFQNDDSHQIRLIKTLLRNGFIDETYLDYISLFHEGWITKSDYQFIINVKSQVQTEYSYKIQNPSKVISKINIVEFEREFILNHSLLDFLLTSGEYSDHKDRIIEQLGNESDTSFDFINSYIGQSGNVALFINELCFWWPNLWNFIESRPDIDSIRQKEYLRLLLNSLNIERLKKLEGIEGLKKYCETHEEALESIIEIDRAKQIISALALKLEVLNFQTTPKEIIDFIYENRSFAINTNMVAGIIDFYSKFSQNEFEIQNFTCIQNSDLEILTQYINEEINTYIEFLYLALSSNHYEEESQLVSLLNNTQIRTDLKNKIIEGTQTKVSNSAVINSIDVLTKLLAHSKVSPTWDNIQFVFESNENAFILELNTFLSNISNAQELSAHRIGIDKEGEKTKSNFNYQLLINDEIADDAYELLLNSISYRFSKLPVKELGERKVATLINKSKLPPNPESFDSVKEFHPTLCISFLEKYKTVILTDINSYKIDTDDIRRILISSVFTIAEKESIINAVDEILITGSQESLKLIGELILQSKNLVISDSLLKRLVTGKELNTTQKIEVHNAKSNQLNKEAYGEFLVGLGDPYSEITIRGRRPSLDKNAYNLQLASILEEKNVISSFSEKEDKIKIATFKNPSEE